MEDNYDDIEVQKYETLWDSFFTVEDFQYLEDKDKLKFILINGKFVYHVTMALWNLPDIKV